VAQKFHFAILRIQVTRASRGLSAIAELLVTPSCAFETHMRRAVYAVACSPSVRHALILHREGSSIELVFVKEATLGESHIVFI